VLLELLYAIIIPLVAQTKNTNDRPPNNKLIKPSVVADIACAKAEVHKITIGKKYLFIVI